MLVQSASLAFATATALRFPFHDCFGVLGGVATTTFDIDFPSRGDLAESGGVGYGGAEATWTIVVDGSLSVAGAGAAETGIVGSNSSTSPAPA